MASVARRNKKRKSDRSAPSLRDRLRRHTPPLAHHAAYADDVIAASQAQGRERDVLYFLADHADAAEEVEMGQQTLSMRFGVEPSTVARMLRKLRCLGELQLVRRAGWHHTNRYRITVPRPCPSPTLTPEQPPSP